MKVIKLRGRDLHGIWGTLSRIRQGLYSVISRSPGLHFREIQRRTRMATGQLLFHLDCLKKMALIKTNSDGQYLRYYTNERIDPGERRVLELARKKSVRRILLHLMEHDYCSHEEITAGVNLSPSTTSWHLKKLLDEGIVDRDADGRRSFYSLNEPELVKNVIIKYRRSFMDKLVDKFSEL